MLTAILVSFGFFYLIFNFLLLRGWKKCGSSKMKSQFRTRVTVIIVVRNEEENIEKLLYDLARQVYPGHLFEVFVFDDHSEDSTTEIVERIMANSELDLHLFRLNEVDIAPKKSAIQRGVVQAKGQLIMVTDGDCRVGENWIASTANAYEEQSAHFIAGPVTFKENRLFVEKLLTIEFSSLIGAGAAFIYFGKPVMCNAANMAFEKTTFIEVKGFEGNENNASGDDIFLMRKIFEKNAGKIIFNKDENAIVQTFAEKTIRGFVNQRIRWAGKWRQVNGAESKMLPILIFSWHLGTLAVITLSILGIIPLVSLFLFIAIKFTGEYLFLKNVMNFLNRKATLVHYFVASLAYPFYAVFMGVAANISGYTWKERKRSL